MMATVVDPSKDVEEEVCRRQSRSPLLLLGRPEASRTNGSEAGNLKFT